jgi:membrane protease YdiL (CAAX protease family)
MNPLHTNDPTRTHVPQVRRRLGWPDLGIAAIAAVVFYAIGIAAMLQVPAQQSALVGLAGYAVSGLAPLCAVAAVLLIRRHGLAAVGLRAVPFRWVAIGAALGLGVVALNIGSVMLMDALSGGVESVQGGYQSAAGAGLLSFAAALVLGALLTPLGEELLFRGVLVNALDRYGPWVAVLVSSAVFALAHGINYLLVVSFTVGVIAALLLRRTGSIWPSVALHAVNNSASVLLPAAYALAG